jgi:hypothetical protein
MCRCYLRYKVCYNTLHKVHLHCEQGYVMYSVGNFTEQKCHLRLFGFPTDVSILHYVENGL